MKCLHHVISFTVQNGSARYVLIRELKLREEKSFSPSQVANKNQKGGLTPAVSDFSKAVNYLGLWAS